RLKQSWFDCYIGRALHPEQRFAALKANPLQALQATRDWWDKRRAQFQVHTPDPQFNALINWTRCTTEYHRQGPGLVLGVQYWMMYSHISTGWYGKEWGGDHAAMDECLRLYGAMQADSGFIRWVSPSLVGFEAEDNTPYWVDQVWRHYTWTGDKQFLRDLWPAVRKAVACMRQRNDPDDDGLFRDFYEYWNCDSNGKGPKAATPSAMAWAMLDRAARMAAVLGDKAAETEYRALADRTRTQIFSQLWREEAGRLGSIGADGLWRGHPQTWEEYLAINAGLLTPEQGRRAMRWLAAHYGFEPQPGVKLLSCSDWFPIRWSTQWVPTGDTCLAALAGLKSGDSELWWPYLKTVVGSAFQSDFPGINMGLSNAGAGGGDREDVDSVDPHCHVAVRGLFGLEPALDQGRLDLCPAFPAAWREAEIRTPDVSYSYRVAGQRAVFRIHTPTPTIKHVRANLTGPEVVTKAETDSTVVVPLGLAVAPPPPALTAPILAEQQPPTEADTGPPLKPADSPRQVLFDLSGACNKTAEELSATAFVFDASDSPQPLAGWWGNPGLTMPATPKVVMASNGVTFLI
ncbi:MAG: GH116 family glycosyl hydrolase, partial [Armatimonadota bacterium]